MKPVERLKMCPNCDGRIPQDLTQCTYCFAQLQIDPSTPSSKAAAVPSTDPLASLYPPPYSTSETKAPPKSPSVVESSQSESLSESIPFWSILMLALGSNLLTLGILQFFFSDHGVLHLEMNASYWFLMIIVAAPLIYFGLKNLSKK